MEGIGENKVEAVRRKNNQTHARQDIAVIAFFVAIGHQPNSDIFKDWLDMDEAGYIKTIPGTSQTNIAGVFAAGDVRANAMNRVASAVGEGSMAISFVHKYLAEV